MNSDANKSLLALLHDVARLTRMEADKRARVYGMTRAQWSLVSRLARYPGISQKELADLLEVEPISVARMVDRLEANNLLERRADASDRRIWRLHLLPAAQPMLKNMAVLGESLSGFITENVPPAVREAMLIGLVQMKSNLLRKSEPGLPMERRGDLPTSDEPVQSGAEPAVPDPLKEIA